MVKNISWFLLVFLILSLAGLENVEASNKIFRIVAVNPSKAKPQSTQIKQYLPVEVTAEDIIDLGGLEIEYDTNRSIYYVYKDEVELEPAEIRVFEVEIKDVWLIPESELSKLKGRIDSILLQSEGTDYITKANDIAGTIYPRLEGIHISQADESVSRQRHISIYRENLITLEEIKEDIARMENIVVTVTAGSPSAPEMLAKSKMNPDLPSQTISWIRIFVIIVLIGLLAGVLFFRWLHRVRLTKNTVPESEKTSFPKH